MKKKRNLDTKLFAEFFPKPKKASKKAQNQKSDMSKEKQDKDLEKIIQAFREGKSVAFNGQYYKVKEWGGCEWIGVFRAYSNYKNEAYWETVISWKVKCSPSWTDMAEYVLADDVKALKASLSTRG